MNHSFWMVEGDMFLTSSTCSTFHGRFHGVQRPSFPWGLGWTHSECRFGGWTGPSARQRASIGWVWYIYVLRTFKKSTRCRSNMQSSHGWYWWYWVLRKIPRHSTQCIRYVIYIYQSLPPKSTQRQVNRPYSELFGIYMNVKVPAQKNIVHVSDMEKLFCSRNYNKMIQ